MKVTELRDALEARALDTTGLKNELIHRLEMALDEEEFGVAAPPEQTDVVVPAASTAEEVPIPASDTQPLSAPSEEPSETVTSEVPLSSTSESGSINEAAAEISDMEKKKLSRAERFGIPVVSTAVVDKSGKHGKRAVSNQELDEKKKARLERFGDVKVGLTPEEIAK